MQLDLMEPLRELAYRAECRVARCAYNEQVIARALKARGRRGEPGIVAARLRERLRQWRADGEAACRALAGALRDLGAEQSGLQWRQERLVHTTVAEQLVAGEYRFAEVNP